MFINTQKKITNYLTSSDLHPDARAQGHPLKEPAVLLSRSIRKSNFRYYLHLRVDLKFGQDEWWTAAHVLQVLAGNYLAPLCSLAFTVRSEFFFWSAALLEKHVRFFEPRIDNFNNLTLLSLKVEIPSHHMNLCG